ncbi:MAG TPA: hypothetical protein VK085_13550 [Pseudogracilibacillus sp.]|nr:hypothetical protein [Pseudogracilibacillus sp.]
MNKQIPIIETDRLILREVKTEDSSDMLLYLSCKDVVKHMDWNL